MVDKLSATERAVAALVAEGAGNKQIAHRLHCGEQTVKNTLTTCFRVLALDRDQNQCVLLARLVWESQQRGEAGGDR